MHMRFRQLSFLFVILLIEWHAYSNQLAIHDADTVKEQIEFKGFYIRQVAFIPWNEKDGITYKQVPGANLGVTSFEIIDSANIAFLSDASNEILIYNFRQEKMIRSFMILPAPRDFAYNSGKFYVLGERNIEIYDTTGYKTGICEIPAEFQGIMRISRFNATTYLLLPSGHSLKMGNSDGLTEFSFYDGWVINKDLSVKTRILNDTSFEISILKENKTTVSRKFSWKGKIAGIFAVGISEKLIILDIQTWISKNPVAVDRHLTFFSYTENELIEMSGMLKVPDHYFILTNKEFSVDREGVIYHLVSTEEGVFVFSITESDTESSTSDYPAFLKNGRYHFNDHLPDVDPFNKTRY